MEQLKQDLNGQLEEKQQSIDLKKEALQTQIEEHEEVTKNDGPEDRTDFFEIKKEKTAEIQKMKKQMLEEMDNLDELQEDLENKRQSIEEFQENLETKRHELRDTAEAELAEETFKIEKEKLRVQNLAQELQAAMDKIIKKKLMRTQSKTSKLVENFKATGIAESPRVTETIAKRNPLKKKQQKLF
eukprot:UN32277